MEDAVTYWPLISFLLALVVLSIAAAYYPLARTKGFSLEFFFKKYFQTYCLVDGVEYGLPNGPRCYPFVGSCYVFTAGISNAISKLARKFGPIFTVYIFRTPCICINDFDLIRQVHTGKNYQNRPKFEVMASLCGEASQQNNGLLFSYGDVWKTHRRLVLRYLRDQGMGKAKGDEILSAEAEILVSNLRAKAEAQLDFSPQELVTKATASLLTRFIFSKPLCEEDNESMVKFFEFVGRMIHSNSSSITLPLLLESYSWMKYLPLYELRRFIENTQGIIEQFAYIAKNRNSSSDKTFNDFIDLYYEKMEEIGKSSNFSIKSLTWTLADLYIAATDTTSVVLLQLIRFLAVNQQIQDRIFEEICDNIDPFETIFYRSVENMHYTNAFIHEVMRIEPPATIGIPRMALEDAILDGYYIPKGALVLCNIRGAHHDPKYWKNPTELDPFRFLDEAGRFHKCDHYVPFSYGKRNCLGETLAQAQVYIFLVSLVREFKFLPPRNSKLDMTTFYWPISSTAQFEIRLECRS